MSLPLLHRLGAAKQARDRIARPRPACATAASPHHGIGRAITSFRAAMAEADIETSDPIVADGRLHRIHVSGDRKGSRNGWYVLHPDGPAAGAFGSWKTGTSGTWSARERRDMDGAELARWREKVAREAKRRTLELEQVRQRARAKAARMWRDAAPADPEHPYLRAKRIRPHGIRQVGDELLVRVVDADGTLRGLQRIGPDGRKRFLAGTEVSGGYFPIGSPNGSVVLAEGYATGAAVHEATGQAVAVAFNAGNLKPAALAVRSKFPDIDITIAADDDRETAGNPGRTAAEKAARAVGGVLVVPTFPNGTGSDFNDLMLVAGEDAVRAAFSRDGTSGSPEGPLPDSGDLTQDGLALRLGDLWRYSARHVAAWGQWLFFDGQTWRPDETLAHMTRARTSCETSPSDRGRGPKRKRARLRSLDGGAGDRARP